MKQEPWEDMFEKLKLYKGVHGNCNVPGDRDKLGRWVKTQRERYRLRILTHNQVDALYSIDFQWKRQYKLKPRNRVSSAAHNKSFHKMVKSVILYVEKHGHGYVPQAYEDKVFALWCRSRRREKANGKLSPERIDELQKVGFVWEFKKGMSRTKDSLITPPQLARAVSNT
jgi:hypothetical protein